MKIMFKEDINFDVILTFDSKEQEFYNCNMKLAVDTTERDLVQYHNGSIMPQVNDLLVFQSMAGGLGHVSIVTNVTDSTVVQTMRYMDLLKELKKSGSKNKKVIS